MEQRLTNISPEELFGTASRLAEQGGENTLLGITSLGGAYQAATAVVALLFIFTLVRYFNLFSHLIISSISKQSNRSDLHIYSADIKNIEIFSSIIGILLISLMAARLSVMEEVKQLLGIYTSLSGWEICGLTLGGVVAMMLGERILLLVAGAMSGRNDACNEIWHTKLLHFSIVIIVTAPLMILTLLTEGLIAKIALYTSVAVCSLSLILFIKETFLLFRSQRFSIFHWFLYLCALEIFPLSLLLAPIVRG